MHSDPQASTVTAPAQSVAGKVKDQLARDYPPGALSWVDGLTWAGPVRVPLSQIDRNAGDWSASDDKRKVASFARRIAAGWRKPVCLIRPKGAHRLFAADGHTRILASIALGQPVTAWVGTAKTEHGDWESTHRRQLPDGGA